MESLKTQDARMVVYRALCLGAILKRCEYEVCVQQQRNTPALDEREQQDLLDEYSALNLKLLRWIDQEKLDHHLSTSERKLLARPLGTWSERVTINISWRVESLGVLLWALNIIDLMPPFDDQFENDEVLHPLDIFTPTIDLIWTAELKTESQLSHMRDIAELWHWRSRAMELDRLGIRPKDGSFSTIILETATHAHQAGKIPPLIDGDFPVFGKPYHQLNRDEFALISAITYERHLALNWICELSSEWETIPVDS